MSVKSEVALFYSPIGSIPNKHVQFFSIFAIVSLPAFTLLLWLLFPPAVFIGIYTSFTPAFQTITTFWFSKKELDRPPEGGIVERIFKTINTQVLKDLPGYTGANVQERPKGAEKEACLTIQDLDRILASFFCDIYNHEPYPKEPRDTRFERWFKGMGAKLPQPLDERELDICLMKEAQRVVQAHGSIQLMRLT